MPSIGQQLDLFLDQLDSLSSTQLYCLIVGATVVLSFLVLNGSAPPEVKLEPLQQMKPGTSKSTGPEPRWHIFRYVNYMIVVAFAASVFEFSRHYQSYTNETYLLLRFLLAWSVCLCYFFGFFGVSFVHDIEQETTTTTPPVVHPPAKHTPVCTDKNTTTTTTTNSTSTTTDYKTLDDAQVAQLVLTHKLKDHELEKKLDPHRAVQVRRIVVDSKLQSLNRGGALNQLPTEPSLNYNQVFGANCEIVVGYVPLPVGLVGPLTINGESVYVPMATTEGCLVASTNRGAKAITAGGGAHAEVFRDGITRAPCVRMASAMEAAHLKQWCETPENFLKLKQAFESTTSFGKLKGCQPTIAGKNVYLRLTCFSGDAMGMNMVSKGSLAVIELLKEEFPSLSLVALSGNMCTDKKAAATNWLEGRGKSVVVEAIIPEKIVKTVLKTTVKAMVETNLHKNLIGSAMAGSIGGFNAHASNIVTAVFLATGQDPAQNVESSNCITLLEETAEGDLWMSCTMPSLEVGTVGGGTSLPAQAACLQAIGCKGGGAVPGENARQLAKVVASATMAGELSLLAALAANTLVQAHMQHNRKK